MLIMIREYKERVKEAYERDAANEETMMDDFVIWVDAIIKFPFYVVRDIAIIAAVILILKMIF